MPDRDWHASPLGLTEPPFAGPNDPAFVIGPEIPQGVIDIVHATFGANAIARAVSISRYSSWFYYFDVLVTVAQYLFMARGLYDGSTPAFSGILQIYQFNTGLEFNRITFGSGTTPIQNITTLTERTKIESSDDPLGIGLPKIKLWAGSDSTTPTSPILTLVGGLPSGKLALRDPADSTDLLTVNDTGDVTAINLEITNYAVIDGSAALDVVGGMDCSGPFTIDSISAPRGIRAHGAMIADVSGISAATLIKEIDASQLEIGRLYEVGFSGRVSTSLTTNQALVTLRNVTGGTTRFTFAGYGPEFGTGRAAANGSVILRRTTNDATFRFYLQASNGGTVAAINPWYFWAYDRGAASDFPDAPQI